MGKRLRSFLKFNVYPMLIVIAIGFVVFQFLPVNISSPIRGLGGVDEARKILKRLRVTDGYNVSLYATDLGNIRLMALTPEGDIIFSAPRSRLRLVQADRDGDGVLDGVKTLMGGLRQVHGVYLDGDWLYYAETHQVSRIRYDGTLREFQGEAEVVLGGLPAGGGHWTRTIKKGPDGWFYVSVGSSCNVCIEGHPWRASIVRFKPGEKGRLYASGLRNSVGFDWRPGGNELYAVENGRDWLGDDFPPEELNLIKEGGFYGWPFKHGDNKPDPNFGSRKSERAERALPMVFGFGAHTAPVSIKFLRKGVPAGDKATALVAQHGSWNRSEMIGYRIVSLHWNAAGEISQKVFLKGFELDGNVVGRPVDIVEAYDGTLYISDDRTASIWRVEKVR